MTCLDLTWFSYFCIDYKKDIKDLENYLKLYYLRLFKVILLYFILSDYTLCYFILGYNN